LRQRRRGRKRPKSIVIDSQIARQLADEQVRKLDHIAVVLQRERPRLRHPRQFGLLDHYCHSTPP
jgi:hypothetical protein